MCFLTLSHPACTIKTVPIMIESGYTDHDRIFRFKHEIEAGIIPPASYFLSTEGENKCMD